MRYGWGVKTKTNHQNNGYIQSLFECNPASENYESGDATLQALRVCWLYNLIFPSTCLWCVHALQPNVKPTISLLALAISNGRGGEGLSTTERGAYTCRIFVKLFRAGFTAITILYMFCHTCSPTSLQQMPRTQQEPDAIYGQTLENYENR